MPLPIAALAPVIGKGALGLFQMLSKNKVKERDTLKTPQSLKEADAISQNLADSKKMAGYGQAKENIKSNSANTIQAALNQGGANSLAALSAIQNNENKALGNLDATNAEFLQNQQNNRVGFKQGAARYDMMVQQDKLAAQQAAAVARST